MKKAIRQSFGVLSLVLLMTTQAFAMDVPISQTEAEINGEQTLTQIYEVSVDTQPETLIKEDFEQNGFSYELISITKDEGTERPEKEVTDVVEILLKETREAAAREEAIQSMQASIEYERDGYKGTLYVNPSTLELAPVNERTIKGTRSIQKSYTNEYNDDGIIPQSVSEGGYTWSYATHSWTELPDPEGGSVPVGYQATVTYQRGTSSRKNDGYTASVEYSGVVSYGVADTVRYTLVYKGYPIVVKEPSLLERIFGVEPTVTVDRTPKTQTTIEKESNGRSSVTVIGVKLLLLALGIACILFACLVAVKLVKRFLSSFVIIYSRDEHSGEDTRIQRVFLWDKKPEITIDYLKAPESRHFLVVLKPKKADKLLGKQLTICIGKKIVKHVVAQSYGTDYKIAVDSE